MSKLTDDEARTLFFNKLGYNEEYFNYKFRIINMSVHSSSEVVVTRKDNINSIIVEMAINQVMKKYGKEMFSY